MGALGLLAGCGGDTVVDAVAAGKDGRDVAGDPLDLRSVRLDQHGSSLVLRVRTQGAWTAGALPANGLCLVVRGVANAAGRACVGSDGHGHSVLRFQRAASGAGFGPPRSLHAKLSRPDARSLVARFDPQAVSLAPGTARWFVESRWRDAHACTDECADRIPDEGTWSTPIAVLSEPRCFGAAARAGRRPCVNPALVRTVTPRPGDALLMPDEACRLRADAARYDVVQPCDFGARDGDPTPRIALVGDSHAQHLRAAVDVLARARGWRAVSLTHPGCAFSTEAYPAPPPIPQRCHTHTDEALHWLQRHPSVHTIITSAAGGRGLSPQGFAAEWARVPASVQGIYVIRDVPRVPFATADCVRSVRRGGRRSVGACSIPRASAFVSDPSADAARSAGGRVRLLDLSRIFCDAQRCYPIIGGVYVYKDGNHLNRVFARTLGPVLLPLIDA